MSFDSTRLRSFILTILIVAVALPAAAGANDNFCDEPGEAPDVIVGNLHQILRYGVVGGKTGFAVGTVSCNVGTCWLDWFQHPSNLHPVIGQSLYRLKDGRMQQIGQGWLKHGFFALSQGFCFNDCQGTNGQHLGVHCSDPYSASLNGQQSNLGPKFEVNPTTGTHPHPVTDINLVGDAIFKRIQVDNNDLDPALNSGALYFVEGQYVTADDSAAGNQNNNVSHRKVVVAGSSDFNLVFDGLIQQTEPAIRGWKVWDTGVAEVDIQADGLYIVASKASDLGGGNWHYEYAVFNMNSQRAGKSFTVPYRAGTTISNVGFSDIEYHSGEPQLSDDWGVTIGANEITWTTDEYQPTTAQRTNALRWGTLYNFWFDADVEPSVNDVTITLFEPGLPATVSGLTIAPNICDNSGVCDAGENTCNCEADCGASPDTETDCRDEADNDCDLTTDCSDVDCCGDLGCFPDVDGDLHAGCLDCDDGDGTSWATPSETLNIMLEKTAPGTVVSWDEPAVLGGNDVEYDVLRGVNPRDFTIATSCMTESNYNDTQILDEDPPPFRLYVYLVRAKNTCPVGEGTLGTNSEGIERPGISCP